MRMEHVLLAQNDYVVWVVSQIWEATLVNLTEQSDVQISEGNMRDAGTMNM